MITVGIKGVEELKRALKNAGQYLREEVDYEIDTTAHEVRNKAVERVPIDEAALKGSISKERVREMEHTVAAPKAHAAYMEFGTKSKVRIPNELQQVASSFKGGHLSRLDAKEAIYAWAKRKGIPKEAWYPIYKSIITKGVNPQPFFFQGWFEERPKLLERLSKILIDG